MAIYKEGVHQLRLTMDWSKGVGGMGDLTAGLVDWLILVGKMKGDGERSRRD
jgi:hypothetical protein